MAAQHELHNYFAHVFLRDGAFRMPQRLFHTVRMYGDPFMADLWTTAAGAMGRVVEPLPPAPRVVMHRVNSRMFVGVVHMPPATGPTLAHRVGLTWTFPPADSPSGAEATLRYFTLECGEARDGVSRTVLCEWTAGGKHLNYGDGPPLKPETAFLSAIEVRCGDAHDKPL